MTTTPEENDPAVFQFWLRFWHKTLATLEVLGGLCGLYYVLFGPLIGSSRVFLILAFVLFTASVWAGILLALGKAGGITVSFILQALQVFQISTSGFLYSFVCGMQFIIGVHQRDDGFELGWFLPARFLLLVNPGTFGAISITGVNVVAILAIICLFYIRAYTGNSAPPSTPATAMRSPEAEITWPPPPEP